MSPIALIPNNEQQAVIRRAKGPVLVLVPVGTGKTLVLAECVRQTISERFAPAWILCLIFTNRAAGEMAARVRTRYLEVASKLKVKTSHGLCALMLRIEARTIGLSQDFMIFDDANSFEPL